MKVKVWSLMLEWNLNEICKNKLSEKEGSSFGYCILKTHYRLSLRKKVLK